MTTALPISLPGMSAAPQFFPSASGFEIKGPVFNSHIYPLPIEAPPHASTLPSPSKLTSLAHDYNSVPLVESEIYAQMLLLRKKGYPLWKPKSDNSRLPESYKREGIHIGDVGILTESGGFDYLFNICQGPDHELNLGRVPEDFRPILDFDCDDTEDYTQEYELGSHVASDPNRIHQRRIPASPTPNNPFKNRLHSAIPDEVGAGLSYSSTASKGALLVLPEGGKRVDHLHRARFEKYAAECAPSWYMHVNGALGRTAYNGSLYLVTGFDKARAWGVASFSDAIPENIQLEYVPKSTHSEDRYPKYWFRTCNSASSSSGADDRYGQQSGCIFLRGFKIAVRETWFREKVTEILHIYNLNADSLFPKAPNPEARWSSILRRWLYPLHQIPTPSEHKFALDEDARKVDLDYISSIHTYHPSDIINHWILQNSSELDVAITHDDDWATVIQEDDQQMPDDEELIRRIQTSNLHVQHGLTASGYTYACFVLCQKPRISVHNQKLGDLTAQAKILRGDIHMQTLQMQQLQTQYASMPNHIMMARMRFLEINIAEKRQDLDDIMAVLSQLNNRGNSKGNTIHTSPLQEFPDSGNRLGQSSSFGNVMQSRVANSFAGSSRTLLPTADEHTSQWTDPDWKAAVKSLQNEDKHHTVENVVEIERDDTLPSYSTIMFQYNMGTPDLIPSSPNSSPIFGTLSSFKKLDVSKEIDGGESANGTHWYSHATTLPSEEDWAIYDS
ncbi:hypothetical protein F5051DRAFT_360565 [Lentinula edodes]|nr:hypothetical protein F5051DRAFT_360565 [Lentinula edodes]